MLTYLNYKEYPEYTNDFAEIIKEAIPQDEMQPIKKTIRFALRKKCCTATLAIDENNQLVGVLYWVFYKDIVYPYLFAVKKEYRNKGYGSEILDHFTNEHQEERIILAHEEVNEKYEDNEMRIRRQGFYQRHGFVTQDYKSCEWGVVFNIVTHNNKKVTFHEYKRMFAKTSGYIVYFKVKKA